MSEAGAEAFLKKIRKMEANRICPNCYTESPTGLGFGNICVKFNTFVCDMCKTSHQAVSHRCKSVSMSTWSMAEVNALTAAKGGGNDAARSIWLASAPAVGQSYGSGRRPRKGDKVDIFKTFIIDCYEKKMFHAGKSDSGGNRNRSGSGDSVRRSKIMQRTLTPKPPDVAVSKSSSGVDLLNFEGQGTTEPPFVSSFESQQSGLMNSSAIKISAPKNNFDNFGSFDNFNSPKTKKDSVFDFDAFSSSVPSVPVATNVSSFDAFSENFDHVAKPSGDNLMDAFGGETTSSTMTNKSSGDDIFDAFGDNSPSKTASNQTHILDMFNDNSFNTKPPSTQTVDVFGSNDAPLLSTIPLSTSQPARKQTTGLEGGSMGGSMMLQGQTPRYGGGAAAISNLGGMLGMGGRPMVHPQASHRNQFDFVGSTMKAELGVSPQRQPPQNSTHSSLTQNGYISGMSNSGLNGGASGLGMSMSMGGGSAAISNMNSIVQQQPKRRGSKGHSTNFPSAW